MAARVLIVDDEPLILDAYSRMLGRNGFDVLPASGPRQALEIVRRNPPIDVILSDVMMPEICGPDLIRKVARISPGTACILMTGGLVDAAGLPADVPLLGKPISKPDLIAAVKQGAAYSAQLVASLRESIEQSAESRRRSEES